MSGSNEYIEELFTEFVERHGVGEVPDPAEFARRAGADEPRLRELIATYLTETAPIPPNAAAAHELAERFAPAAFGKVVELGFEAAWMTSLRHQLQTWLVATIESRREILDHISADLPALYLRAETARGKEREQARHCVFQLDHPAGAQVEVRDDRVLLLTVLGLPTQFIGSRPLVALPRAALADTPQLSWAGCEQGLPDGIALAEDNVLERRELQVVLGQLSSESSGSLDSLLAEICVIGRSSGGRT